uniref:Uncharacterized protein n=1 Tax=Tetraselmis sp. GSL018 TaxID=582737 RepID=A0A061R3I4_9CHLO
MCTFKNSYSQQLVTGTSLVPRETDSSRGFEPHRISRLSANKTQTHKVTRMFKTVTASRCERPKRVTSRLTLKRWPDGSLLRLLNLEHVDAQPECCLANWSLKVCSHSSCQSFQNIFQTSPQHISLARLLRSLPGAPENTAR